MLLINIAEMSIKNAISVYKTKSEIFILQDFWPMLKIFQFFGLFPWKKTINENGTVHLQPIKIQFTLVILTSWCLIVHSPPMTLFFYLKHTDKYNSKILKLICFENIHFRTVVYWTNDVQ